MSRSLAKKEVARDATSSVLSINEKRRAQRRGRALAEDVLSKLEEMLSDTSSSDTSSKDTKKARRSK